MSFDAREVAASRAHTSQTLHMRSLICVAVLPTPTRFYLLRALAMDPTLENISRSRPFADDDRVTVGVRIVYCEAQAQKHGLLPPKWEPVGKKALAKVYALCDILGCRPAQNKLTISATVPGAVETIHNNRRYDNPLIPAMTRKVNQLSIEFMRGYGVKSVVMHVLPNAKRDLRDHPQWSAVHAYAGNPSLVSSSFHSRIRQVLSRKGRASAPDSAFSVAGPSTTVIQDAEALSPIIPTALPPLRFSMSDGPPNSLSVGQLPGGSTSSEVQLHPVASSEGGCSMPSLFSQTTGAGGLNASDCDPIGPLPSMPAQASGSAVSSQDPSISAADATDSRIQSMTSSSAPITGAHPPTSLKRPHSALADSDDTVAPPTKLRKTKGPLPITRSMTAQAKASQTSSSGVMLSSRSSAPAPAPALAPQEYSAMQNVVRDLLVEKAMLVQANNACATHIQAQAAHIQVLQQEVSKLPDLQARLRSVENNSEILHRELGTARVRVAELESSQRSHEENLKVEREENRRLAAQIADLEARVARVPELEREVQLRMDEVQSLNSQLQALNEERSSTLTQLRTALGDENALWDDAPLSMMLLAVERKLSQREVDERGLSRAEDEAQGLRARLSAAEWQKTVGLDLAPALTDALAHIAEMVNSVSS
ncbi:unnamed protein product [Peniophora sp. CBMAI 1063]|nr:unnamed protein product [Peniophora sp. CBMAI 1063]